MAAAMLDFSTYIADRTKDFIGREWVFAEIDRWLADPSVSQYFVITGEPGIGKTSLLARLTQTIRVDAHHFCIAREGGTLEPISFIRSINRQLSINLPGFTDHVLAQERISIATNISVVNVAAGAHIYGTYVEKLISQAQSADEAFEYLIRIPLREWVASNQASKCVLILVDAFDEGARLERHPNIPDLIDSARDLPLEVRWLITSRPHAFLQTLPSARFVILDSSAENISDVKKYVSSILDKPPIEKSLRSHRLSIDKVRDELIKRSGGNFLYLRYQRDQLLEAAGAGQAIILSQKPPIGLDGVYLEFLDRMFRSLKDRWEKIYLPVLGAMAVAQDTLSFGQIVGFSGVQAQGVSWVLSDLMQFLDITDAEGDARYRLYHVSFADFLIDHVRNPDYWIDPEIANQRIGEYYWLRYRNQWLDCDRYGVLYLSTHLTQADQGKRLCELLTESSTWMQALFRVHFSHEALVADLNLAITFFEDPLSSNQFLTLIQLYALRSLLQHQVNIYDETDLRILVLLSREAEALGIARLRHTVNQRLDGLLTICNTLADKGRGSSDLLDEIHNLALSAELEDYPFSRMKALYTIATSFRRQHRVAEAEAILELARLASVAAQKDSSEDSDVYHQLSVAVSLSEMGYPDEALQVSLSMTDKYDEPRIQALCKVASAYAISNQNIEANHVVALAEDSLNAMESNWIRPYAITFVAEAMVALKRVSEAVKLLDHALSVAKQITDGHARDLCLEHIAIGFAQTDEVDKANEAIRMIYRYEPTPSIVKIIAQRGAFESAIVYANEMIDKRTQARAYSTIAEELAQRGQLGDANQLLGQAMQIKRVLDVEKKIDGAFTSLGVSLADLGRIADAMTIIGFMLEDWRKDEVRSSVAIRLIHKKDFHQAQAIVQSISKKSKQIFPLVNLSVNMSLAGYKTEAGLVLEQTTDIAQENKKDGDNLLGIAVALAWLGDFEKANTNLQEITKDDSRARAILGIAQARFHLEDPQRAIEEIKDMLASISSLESLKTQVSIMCEAARMQKSFQRQDLARRTVKRANVIANSISDKGEQAIAKSEVAKTLRELGDLAESIHQMEIAVTLTPNRGMDSELSNRLVSEEVIRAGKHKLALEVLQRSTSRNVSDLFEFIAKQVVELEKIETGLTIKALKEIARIASWEHAEWQQVHQSLHGISLGE